MKNKITKLTHYLGIGREHKIILMICLLIVTIFRCVPKNEQQSEDAVTVEATNPLDELRQDVLVQISNDQLGNEDVENLIVIDGDQQLPAQYVEGKGLLVLLNYIDGGASKKLIVRKASEQDTTTFKKRTQAELSVKEGGEWQDREYIGGSFKNVDSLRVPDEHTDHSWYIRYEGPGWESDKVGYRFYLDWRNAMDVFGKKTSDVVLQNVGQDGFDSYHEMQGWGMDVLKVGPSLGIGSPAVFHDGKAVRIDSTDSVISKVLVNGDLYSAIRTNYYGWKVGGKELNVKSTYSIHAGSRITQHQLEVEGNPENIATGIGKSDSARFFSDKGSSQKYGYLATFGRQSLNNDKLGLAVLFSSDKLIEITEDEYNHIVTLRPEAGKIEYYFLAAWELEKNGIKTEEEFINYLNKAAEELANPVTVRQSSTGSD